jgi:uncharacterized protein (DUF305 family)
MPSSDRVSTATSNSVAFNGADLHYLRGALLALKDVHRASDVAAAGASDPRVRALARRASATQADDIGVITSMLLGWGREGGLDQAGAASDLRSLDGLEIDRRFIEILTAHDEASLVSARTEMVEGFGGSSRRHAEDTSRANWRELAELSLIV